MDVRSNFMADVIEGKLCLIYIMLPLKVGVGFRVRRPRPPSVHQQNDASQNLQPWPLAT